MTAQAPERLVTAAKLAESERQAQLALRAALLVQVGRLWSGLDVANPTRTWQPWVGAMTALLVASHRQMGERAALYYRGARQLEIGDPGPPVTVAAPPTEEWVIKALGFSGPGVFDAKMRRLADRLKAEHAALVSTLGTASRIAMDGQRTTLVDATETDPADVRYYRVTDAEPCAWCALLASRGAVYRSAAAAGEMNAYHNNCGCTVGVSFTGQIELTGAAATASGIYAEHAAHLPNAERLPAFRKAWRQRSRSTASQAA